MFALYGGGGGGGVHNDSLGDQSLFVLFVLLYASFFKPQMMPPQGYNSGWVF